MLFIIPLGKKLLFFYNYVGGLKITGMEDAIFCQKQISHFST